VKKIMHLNDFAQATEGRFLSLPPNENENTFTKIGTDSRKDLKDNLFIALKGESFDGHDFLEQAVNAGAKALVVHTCPPVIEKLKNQVCIIQVNDTLKALQQFSSYLRRKSSAKIIGITGSNGKTTSKEFTAQLLQNYRRVHFSLGSFNNHWGVPFTLIDMPNNSDVAIVEMGMNHAGEITELVKIAEPDIVVCSMVGRAHIEFFGTIEKIAEAKEEIYLQSSPTAMRIFNLDNEYTCRMWHHSRKLFNNSSFLNFSEQDSSANVHLKVVRMDFSGLQIEGHIQGEWGQVLIPIFGRQNITNIMVAATCALAAGLTPQEIWESLPRCRTNWGRNQLVHLKSGARVLFDGYNANPDSMKALIENIKSIPVLGKKVGVFGQMREQGAVSFQVHKELGVLAGNSHFSIIFFIGEDFAAFEAGLKASKFNGKSVISDVYKDSLASELASVLHKEDIAIIKGSRGMKMERFFHFCEPLDFNFNKESNV